MPGSSPWAIRSALGLAADGRHALGESRRGDTDETATLEHVEGTGALADQMRRRLETRLPANATRREQRHRLVAEEPAGRFGDVPRVCVLGERDDQPSADLVVQRRDDQRQHRLGDAGARRQRLREFLEALFGANALDEAVENRTVHDFGPNEAFGRGSWYAFVSGC